MRKNRKIILLFIGLIGIFSFVFAKYVSNTVWNYYLQTKGFYFSSDHLETNIVNNLWDGSEVHFNIKNSLNKNVITEYDIEYTLACSVVDNEALDCYLNGTDSDTIEGILLSKFSCINSTDKTEENFDDETSCEAGGHEWVVQEVKNDLYFEIDSKDQPFTAVTVEITATSTAPYSKTITGYFTLNKNKNESEITMLYQNYSNYDRLIISNPTTSSKCVKINWDASKLLVDETDFNSYNTDDYGYINEISVEISSKKSLSYIFYKTNFSNEYDISEFILTEITCNPEN